MASSHGLVPFKSVCVFVPLHLGKVDPTPVSLRSIDGFGLETFDPLKFYQFNHHHRDCSEAHWMNGVMILFYVFSFVTVLGSLAVVLMKNPILSALSLVVSFFGVAGIFVLLHAPFVATIQVWVYAGAILVLFLYVTMLLNIGGEMPEEKKRKYSKFVWLVLGLLVSGLIFKFGIRQWVPPFNIEPSSGSIESIASQLLNPYLLLFELISVVLLVGILGAIVLAKKGGHAP
jgi:NADH-quinone oxidoreductase subunit J